MVRIVATALLSFLLLTGKSLRAAQPAAVLNLSCSGTAEANDSRRPVKKIGLIINIFERTVTVSGLSVVAHVDSADDVNIQFGGESTIPWSAGRQRPGRKCFPGAASKRPACPPRRLPSAANSRQRRRKGWPPVDDGCVVRSSIIPRPVCCSRAGHLEGIRLAVTRWQQGLRIRICKPARTMV
jgi:hypothetical protein